MQVLSSFLYIIFDFWPISCYTISVVYIEMELHLRERTVDIMKIQASAVSKLQYFFSNFKWSRNDQGIPDPISEEILEALFRKVGANELSTISLFTFKEHTLAVRGMDEGFTFIEMELFAPEFDDFFKLSYRFEADPKKMSEKTEKLIDFDGLRRFRRFIYDFKTGNWELSGR